MKIFTIKDLEEFLLEYKRKNPYVPLTADGLVQLFKKHLEESK